MPYGSTATTPQIVGVPSGANKAVAISSGATPPFVVNWNATVLTDASAVLCVDVPAIIAGTASGHANIPILDLSNGLGQYAGSQLLLWAECGHTSAPTIGGTLQVGVLGRCPPRGPGLPSLVLAHEIYSASFPTIDPEVGKWNSVFDIDGNQLITIPLPSVTAPECSDTTTAKKMYQGKKVRVPLYGMTHLIVPIRGAMTVSAGYAVVYGQIVN